MAPDLSTNVVRVTHRSFLEQDDATTEPIIAPEDVRGFVSPSKERRTGKGNSEKGKNRRGPLKRVIDTFAESGQTLIWALYRNVDGKPSPPSCHYFTNIATILSLHHKHRHHLSLHHKHRHHLSLHHNHDHHLSLHHNHDHHLSLLHKHYHHLILFHSIQFILIPFHSD